MLCPSCKLQMRIDHNEYKITGDDSPETSTQAFSVLYFKCPNKQCNMFEKVVEGDNIPLL